MGIGNQLHRLNARRLLNRFGVQVKRAFEPGATVMGRQLYVQHENVRDVGRSGYALDHCLRLKPATVLDVGSGGGEHASAFVREGAKVTCLDFGTSVYAQRRNASPTVVTGDFLDYSPPVQFDLVWASHVLEHQRNVGPFIERLIACCSPAGHVAITVPTPHRELWGGI